MGVKVFVSSRTCDITVAVNITIRIGIYISSSSSSDDARDSTVINI